MFGIKQIDVMFTYIVYIKQSRTDGCPITISRTVSVNHALEILNFTAIVCYLLSVGYLKHLLFISIKKTKLQANKHTHLMKNLFSGYIVLK